ncbi:hypothetical protein MJO29_003917 [Puccinia striiformis f. sp. tritici]|uniref:F-box domain-containing protein n=1 Tax=Puccinia striiformis f. sp. tritici PST-78 TaxID=1165861 RepID=A0A0L0VK95_9BASI|nr:hypothetical protein Pst134EB_008173 [Puccinia striiformis f. sp. tritici]KAI7963490.1 hypothetical protein MJO29_003917 [Puccinia striiformis f. sp. tritici]KAI9617382.1 hypothetical protein KEM48_004834 [Puccinia striiformis f. sp. tritici PST-130]KNE99409.1 hypothetical protein PSTG_07339 [Puccinia striiformis f. sp. tritici PST-78]
MVQPDFQLNPNPFDFPTEEERQEQISSSYNVNGFGVIDRPATTIIPRLGVSNGLPGGGDCAKLCPRHQRMANEGTNRALQEAIENLPQTDQEAINTVWSVFSASNVTRRRLILTGLLTICCPSQLTFLTDSLRSACRTDPFSRLPKELSLRILSYFDAFSLGRAAQVSKLWKKLADDDLLWREMCQQHIERTCQKCGWGLPSMQKRKRSPSLPSSSLPPQSIQSEKRSKSSDPSAKPVLSTPPPPPSSPPPPVASSSTSILPDVLTASSSSSHQQQLLVPTRPSSPTSNEDSTKPWKSVYTERLALERNWRKGIYVESILTGHTDSITCLQFEENFESPSFPILMTGSWDRTIRIWNVTKAETIQILNGHTRGIKCLQFDTNKLISGGMDNVLKLWNWRTGECIRTINGHNAPVTCLNFDDQLLASGSADSTIRIWDFNTGAGYVLRGHQEWVNTVKLDTKYFNFDDGLHSSSIGKIQSNRPRKLKLLYSGSDDGQIRIWNLASRETLKILVGHVAQVQSLSLLPSSSSSIDLHQDFLISGSLDNCLKLWNIKFNLDSSSSMELITQQQYQQQRIGGGDGLDIEEDRVMEVGVDGVCDRTMFGHIQGVWSIDSDKLRIVSASHDRSLKIWDRSTGKCVHTFVGHRGAVSAVKLTDDKIISGGDDGEVRIWWFGKNSL